MLGQVVKEAFVAQPLGGELVLLGGGGQVEVGLLRGREVVRQGRHRGEWWRRLEHQEEWAAVARSLPSHLRKTPQNTAPCPSPATSLTAPSKP